MNAQIILETLFRATFPKNTAAIVLLQSWTTIVAAHLNTLPTCRAQLLFSAADIVLNMPRVLGLFSGCGIQPTWQPLAACPTCLNHWAERQLAAPNKLNQNLRASELPPTSHGPARMQSLYSSLVFSRLSS
jgi:hypothetical protein